jgi:hypothetical protein
LVRINRAFWSWNAARRGLVTSSWTAANRSTRGGRLSVVLGRLETAFNVVAPVEMLV